MSIAIPPELVATLREAKHVVVLTGAGTSAESGIPTFRDRLTGLWQRFDAEDLANADAFTRDPELVWGWYEWRRMIVMKAQPNAAHVAIARMAEKIPKLTLVTQNVDDLHERGGNTNVLHLHGRLNRPFCFACRRPHPFPSDIPNEPEGGRRLAPPRCDFCGGLIRPGVVWFGEMLPESVWDAAIAATNACDVLFSVGTSSMVQPAAGLPIQAVRRGVPVVQVNPASTSLDWQARFNLVGAAGEVLPQLVDATWPE